MTLFKIQCDTCRSRLKVTDRSAIGQLLACPKCNSMVEIQPPKDWSGESTESTEAVSGSNQRPSKQFPGSDPHGQPVRAKKREKQEDSFATDSAAFEDIDSLLEAAEIQKTRALSARSRSKTRKRQNPVVPPPAPNQLVDVARNSDQPVLPGADWTSTTAKARQKMLLLYGGSAVGILIGLGVLAMLFSQLFGANATTVARDSTHAADGQAVSVVPPDTKLSQTNDTTVSGLEEKLVDPLEDPLDPPNPTKPPNLNEVAINDNDARESEHPSEVKVKPVETPERFVGDDEDLPEFMRKPDRKVEGSSAEGIGDDAMPGLREINDFLETSSFDKALETGMPTPSLSGEYTRKITYVDKPLEIKNVRIDRQLGTKIEGILFEDLTRIQLVRLIETLTEVPVTVEPDALLSTGLRLSDKFDMRQKTSVSVLGLLSETFNHPEIAIETGKHGVVVGKKRSEVKQLKQTYKFDDMLSDEFTIETIKDVIQLFVSPSSWADNGGDATMIVGADEILIQHTSQHHEQIKEFLSLFRLARQTRFGEARGAVFAPRHQAAISLLEDKSKVEYIQEGLLGDLARDIATSHGLSIILDSESLYEDGWNLNTEVRFGGPDKTLYQSLEELLSGMQLSMIGYADGVYLITTPRKSASLETTEFYLIDDIVKSPEESTKLAEQIRTLMHDELNRNPNAAFFVSSIQDQSFLIVKSSQHKQISVDEYLGNVRSVLKKKK